MPDIIRLFKGPRNEFEVEVVFAELGDESPKESHTFDEIMVLVAGSVELERSDEEKTSFHEAVALIEIPAGVEHQIRVRATSTRGVIIHPERH